MSIKVLVLVLVCACLDRIPACDGQTDVQTSCHDIVRAMHTRRAVKLKDKAASFKSSEH